MHSGEYEMDGLIGIGDSAPTCPKCGRANAMIHDSYHVMIHDSYHAAIKNGAVDNGGSWENNPVYHCYICRDCGYIHIKK